ncbi:MAG: stage III sporulation protein AE [Clostridia bacterium]|nr:stage III sporulation protein AE [Clostridia bacterium]
MKKAAVLFLIILITTPVRADDYNKLDSFGITEAGFTFSDAVNSMTDGHQIVKANEMWPKIYEIAVSEINTNLSAVSVIFALSFLLAVFSTSRHRFKGGENAAFLSVYMIITGIITSAFGEISKLGISLIQNTVLFLNSVIPILGTAIAGSAGAGVFASLSPQILIFSSLCGNLIKSIGMPAVYFSFGLSLIGNLSPHYSTASLAKVIRSTALWIVSGAVTIFSAVVSVSGMSCSSLNAAALKSAKFAVSGLVPVLGSLMTDSIEAVAGGAVVIKNIIGSAGILFIFFSVLFPVIKIASVIFIYKISSALIGTFGDKRITSVLDNMAGVLSAITGFIIACSVSCIISLSVLLGASNLGGAL